MEEKIKKMLSLLRKERIIINKMVEADEKDDKMLFYTLQKPYKEISINTDNLVNELLDKKMYNSSVDYLSNKIKELIDKKENTQDYITLIGFINSFNLNRISNDVSNSDSDVFSNEFVMQVYDIYLWLIKENTTSKEFNNSLRLDILMKLVNSRAIRKYFSGDYEEASEIANPLKNDDYKDRNKLGTIYASLLLAQIELSNKFEMYDGIIDEESFKSRKKMLEIEFAAISMILMKRGFLIPPNSMDYSNFTEEVLENASNLVNEYIKRKPKEQNKILIKQN